MATKDFPIHQDFKNKLVECDEKNTLLVMKSLKNPSRVLKTPWSEKILEAENKGATLEELAPLISGSVSGNGWRDGAVEEGMYPARTGDRAHSRRPDDVGARGEDRRRSHGGEGGDRSTLRTRVKMETAPR